MWSLQSGRLWFVCCCFGVGGLGPLLHRIPIPHLYPQTNSDRVLKTCAGITIPHQTSVRSNRSKSRTKASCDGISTQIFQFTQCLSKGPKTGIQRWVTVQLPILPNVHEFAPSKANLGAASETRARVPWAPHPVPGFPL